MSVLHGPGNHAAAGRFLILSYFYGFFILGSDQVAGTYSVAPEGHPKPEDLWMCMHAYEYVYVRGLSAENHFRSQRTKTPCKIKVNSC